VDVADFGPGEPDFPTPDHIKKAAIKAIEENKSKYTPTAHHAAARSHLRVHKRELGSSYEAKECVVTSRKALHLQRDERAYSAGRRGHHPAPYWVSFPDIVKYAGGTPVFVETKPEGGSA